MIEGGHDYDGRPIVPFDEVAMLRVARQIRASGIRSVAVAAIFSPLDPGCEERADGGTGRVLEDELLLPEASLIEPDRERDGSVGTDCLRKGKRELRLERIDRDRDRSTPRSPSS